MPPPFRPGQAPGGEFETRCKCPLSKDTVILGSWEKYAHKSSSAECSGQGAAGPRAVRYRVLRLVNEEAWIPVGKQTSKFRYVRRKRCDQSELQTTTQQRSVRAADTDGSREAAVEPCVATDTPNDPYTSMIRDRPSFDDLAEYAFIKVELCGFAVVMEVSPIIRTTKGGRHHASERRWLNPDFSGVTLIEQAVYS